VEYRNQPQAFFLALTSEYSSDARKALSWRIAVNSFVLIVGSYFAVSSSLIAFERIEQSQSSTVSNLRPKRSSWNASAAANSADIPRSADFFRAIASAVSAASTPRTENPSDAI
jgi:hypothetical protein